RSRGSCGERSGGRAGGRDRARDERPRPRRESHAARRDGVDSRRVTNSPPQAIRACVLSGLSESAMRLVALALAGALGACVHSFLVTPYPTTDVSKEVRLEIPA